jgi:autotransporter-associated beta strand protein
MQPVFMSAGSPLGSADGAVNLCNGGLYFDNQYSVNPGAIAKGALNIEGQNVIYIGTPAAVTSTVTFASINRNQRGQLSLGSTSAAWIGGLARLVATAAPTPVNGMVEPWLVYGWGAGSGTFLNYGGAGYTQAAYHVTVPAGAFPSLSGGTNVVQVTGAATLGDDPDIHALRADAAIGGAANTITLRSGGLILNSASTHTMKLKFGAAGDTEGIVYAAANAALSGTLTTTAGLTKGGPGELTLGADNTATLGGKIVINGGRLLVSADSALGQAANVVCLNGGGLQGSIAHTVSVGRVGGYLTGGPLSGPIVDETPGTPGGPLVVTVFNLVLSATNTFTCPLIVTGSIRVDGTGTPGKGPVTIKAGGAVTLFSSSGIDSAGRYSLQSGNNVASLILDASGTGGPARFYRLGSVEGSGNISFGSYLYPPANSALIVGNDNTSCDYGGSILQTPLASLNYAVVKEGTGTWTLWGDSVWQGPLIVSNGVLQVNGSIEGVSGATVCGGATLGGRGTIGAPLTVEAGGNLTGSLVFASNLTLGATASLDVTLAGTNAVSQYGQTQAAGVVNLNGAALVLRLGAAPVGGAVYTILDNRSALPVSGAFANAADGATLAASYGGRTCYFKVNYAGGDGNDVTLTAIPRSAGIYVW